MRIICLGLLAGAVVLLAPALPQLASADTPPQYSITVSPLSGAYGESIGVWIGVPEDVTYGTYHICWDSASLTASMTEIYAPAAGTWPGQFAVPEAAGGNHTGVLHLVRADGQSLATASFGIYPKAMMSPSKGPVGTVVTIQGYGFQANETGIPIEFRGSEIKRATANANGSWTETHTIPNLPAGSYAFDVGPDRLNERYWHMHFTVTAKITISKTSGAAGEVVMVSGTGFAASENGIKITFDGETIKDGISAGTDGSFSNEEVVIPRRGSGTYEIGASGFTTWARDVPPVDFTIETGVSASPIEAYVGDEVAVMGSGFAAWETGIRVTFDGRAVDTGSITADKYGTWEASFMVPTSTFGDKPVSAYGDSTPVAAVETATVKVLARIEVNPLEGSPGDPVILTGTGFPGDQALTVTFANKAVPETVRSLANGDLSAVVTVPADSPAGTLSVTTTGGGSQASTDFTVTEKILPTPQPISP